MNFRARTCWLPPSTNWTRTKPDLRRNSPNSRKDCRVTAKPKSNRLRRSVSSTWIKSRLWSCKMSYWNKNQLTTNNNWTNAIAPSGKKIHSWLHFVRSSRHSTNKFRRQVLKQDNAYCKHKCSWSRRTAISVTTEIKFLHSNPKLTNWTISWNWKRKNTTKSMNTTLPRFCTWRNKMSSKLSKFKGRRRIPKNIKRRTQDWGIKLQSWRHWSTGWTQTQTELRKKWQMTPRCTIFSYGNWRENTRKRQSGWRGSWQSVRKIMSIGKNGMKNLKTQED